MRRSLLATAVLMATLSAQAVAQQAAEPPDPQLKPNPQQQLRDFEPAADEEYRLGKGDEITIDFTGRPEMQAHLTVGPDGRITLPLAGDLLLYGLTRPEAGRMIGSALETYYNNLVVQVTVTRYASNHILVLGAVEHPGLLNFDGTPTLLEALTRAGLTTATNKTGRMPERCAVYRGSDQVVWVQLKAMVDAGDPLADLRLRRDDVVFVPSESEHFLSVLGAVAHPGAVPLTSDTTLASLIASVGGFTEQAGGNPHIQIVDQQTGQSRVFEFKDMLNPHRTLELTLKPGQIIYVPQSGFNRATYALQRLSPLLALSTLSVLGVR